MENKFTHIRVNVETKRKLDEVKAIGQSYDGLIQELINIKKEGVKK